MRFRGGGIGHKSFQKEIRKFFDDRWPNELKDIKNQAGTGNSEARMDVEQDLSMPEQTLMQQQPTIRAEGGNSEVTIDLTGSEDDVELPVDQADEELNNSDLELQEQKQLDDGSDGSASESDAEEKEVENDGNNSDDLELEYADF